MKALSVLTIILMLAIGLANEAGAQQKVLIVSTNIDSLQEETNGTFLMEMAYPLAEFVKAGIEVTILTPKGGKAAVYHRGKMDSSLAAIQQSKVFTEAISHSLAPSQIQSKEYAGIFYPGGGGQFYDVWDNADIAGIAAQIYEQGGVIGAAGHGAVSLLNIQLSNGSFLVKGKKITCFPKSISAKWLPIDWEQGLADKGASVVLPVTSEEKENGVQLLDDGGKIVSGSYAENAAWVAKKMSEYITKTISAK